ncbi:5-hydroxytryptamine receptor 3A-like [Embiotoca jacksoni]|uniref:5-hydroxytryptamine receptor 3A-like n=1 Tax=Embiotoca jacksoni TaxID=100190 RepID=UPI0037046754
MAALRTLALLALTCVSSSQTSDCSYSVLLEHFNLTETNALLEMARPVKNWTASTLVQLDMLVYGILKVDEKSQTVTAHIWLSIRWTNEFLTWNPSDFCGIDSLSIPRSKVWIPDISIQEDASDTGTVQKSPFVTVSPSGTMNVEARQRLTYTCQFNLNLFPFDTQNCNITYWSMSGNARSIMLGTVNNKTTLSFISERIMITQGEWKLKSLDISQEIVPYDGEHESKLIYMVSFERKPMLYVINLIFPLFYLLVLDLASFFINEARGEKLSFKVTVLLSISLLLLILQDMLPSTEENLPMIAIYFITVFALVGLSVLEVMLVSFLVDLESQCSEEARSSEDVRVDVQLEAEPSAEAAGVEEKGPVKPEKSYRPSDRPGDRDLLKLILDEVKAARQGAGKPDRDKGKSRCYRKLAYTIDIVYFVFYFLTVVIFGWIMYVKWIKQVILFSG